MANDPQPTSSGQEGLVTTEETDDTDRIELLHQSIDDKITIQNTVDFVSYMVSAYIMLGHYVKDTFKVVDESVSQPMPMFMFGNGQQQSGNEEEEFDNNFDYFNWMMKWLLSCWLYEDYDEPFAFNNTFLLLRVLH